MGIREERQTELMLYLHIPFCVRKCAYCDFLSAPAGEEVRACYVEALKEEIRRKQGIGEGRMVTSVFFGGGTPSLLAGVQLEGILEEVRGCFCLKEDGEITVECNPGTLTRDKLLAYQRAGVNRLSLGLQSADNEELALLGRIHTYEEFLEGYSLAREMDGS